MAISISITPVPDERRLALMRQAATKRGGKVVVAGDFACVLERNPGLCADCGLWDSHIHDGLCPEHFAADRNLDRDVQLARQGGGDLDPLDGGPDDQGPTPPPAA